MEAETIRKQLVEMPAALQRIEAEREVMINIVKGYEGWLKLYDQRNGGAAQPPLLEVNGAGTKKKRGKTGVIQGTISVRSAILQVVKDARGVTLHSEEIWQRAEAMGARTKSDNPKDVVDLNLFGLRQKHPIEKMGPRLYRWTGDD